MSAVAGYINPSSGQLNNADRASVATFVGAVCFFVGALLLLPERTEPEQSQPEQPQPDQR